MQQKGEAFLPNSDITREELAAIVIKAYQGYTGNFVTQYEDIEFTDESELNDSLIKYAKIACKLDILSCTEEESFKPKETVTIEEAVEIVYKLNVLIKSEDFFK